MPAQAKTNGYLNMNDSALYGNGQSLFSDCFQKNKMPPVRITRGHRLAIKKRYRLRHGVHAFGVKDIAFLFKPLSCGLAVPRSGF